MAKDAGKEAEMKALELSFRSFASGGYCHPFRDYNLYVVYRRRHCVYVGSSTRGAWARWFSGFGSHLRKRYDGRWIGCDSIGQEVAGSPGFIGWRIELRDVRKNLRLAEARTIRRLRPELNVRSNG